jgi:COP9 signalosome complex subunit 3
MASALEHYVNSVRTMTSAGNFGWFLFFCVIAYFFFIFFLAGNFRELVDYLNDSAELLSRNINLLDNVLETLDLQNHSLGALYVVAAKISDIQLRV